MLGKVNSGIDRARQVLPGTSVGLIGTSSGANPDKKYSNPELRYPTCKVCLFVCLSKPMRFLGAMVLSRKVVLGRGFDH